MVSKDDAQSLSNGTSLESSESSMTSSTSQHPDHQGDSSKGIKELFLFSSTDESLRNLSSEPYTNLTTLIILNQTVSSLTGIGTLKHLIELWLTECNLKDDDTPQLICKSLKYLYLYSNDLTKIPDLSNLDQLQLLGLSENKISSIENIDFLQELRKLYLAENNIKSIGYALQNNKKLTDLDISRNPIRSLHDLAHLSENAALRSLTCTDYTELSRSPVALSCNYRTFLIRHLPQVVVLDGFQVTEAEQLKVSEFYGKTIMFYNVLHHSYLSHHFAEATIKNYENDEMLACMKQAQIKLKLRGVQTNQLNKRLMKKLPGPEEKVEELSEMVLEWKDYVKNWKTKHGIDRSSLEDQLNLELRSVGNLSFRRDVNDTTFISLCQKLMTGYTCENLTKQKIKLDVKVIRAWRVFNNGVATNEDLKHTYMLMAKVFTTLQQLCDWFDNGWHGNNGYELTTCLATAAADWSSDRRGRDLTYNTGERHFAVVMKAPLNIKMDVIVHTRVVSYMSQSSNSSNKTCHLLKITNPENIPSICVIEYQYVLGKLNGNVTNPKRNCQQFMNGIINYPAISDTNLVEFMNLDTLQKIVKHLQHPEPWNCLTTICLQGVELDGQFGENIPQFVSARSLDISYNNITTLEFVARLFPNLRDLNLSYNKIISLSTLSLEGCLVDLNLSWNDIRLGRSCLQEVSTKNPNLEVLNLSNNPLVDFNVQEHLISTALQLLPHLKVLNEVTIEDFRQTVFVVNLEEEVVGKGAIGNGVPVSLSLCWPSFLFESPFYNDGSKIEDENLTRMWVSLRDRRIVDLSNLPTNVARADLSRNFISDLKFLESWTLLEDLSLSRNNITSLGQDLLSIQNIVKLDLSDNYIKSLGALKDSKLTSLRYLDVSNNKLKCLTGLETCTALREMYATNNFISTLQDLVEIKSCRQLRVVDVSGNEVSYLAEFKNYSVFHFRKIEFINGKEVQESNLEEAFELFGGILDADYLLRCHKKTDLVFLKHMSITQCCVKKINLEAGLLPCLETLNLEGNEISSLSGAHLLPSLVSLNLGFNQIDNFCNESSSDRDICFPKLETLYLNNNQITSLESLGLHSLPCLESLFLQGNQLQDLNGLPKGTNLKNLLIDRNKIEELTLKDCAHLKNVDELYVEGNKMKDLAFLRSVPNLTKLFVGHNRVEDPEQLRYLSALTRLRELTLLGNPLCRVFHHYRQAIAYVPTLETLDGLSLDLNTLV